MITNRLHTFWILTALIWYTALTSVRMLFTYSFRKSPRARVDRIIHRWVDQLLGTVGVQYKVHNPHKVQPEMGKATILMCNHSSLYDIPLAFKAFPTHSIRMLAKKELFKIPLFGKAMAAAEFPFVDRKNRYQSIKDLAYAQELMKSGIVIWIAPEGTRSKDGKLTAFKKGAFITAIQAKATIIPIGIKGAFDILPARSFSVNLNQKAEICIGEPIDAAEYTVENKAELIEKTFKSIESLLK